MEPSDIKPGMKFGHLTIVTPKQVGKTRHSWLCECECGKTVVLGFSALTGTKNRRPNKSCGCRNYAHNGLIMKNRRLFDVWNAMMLRCYDPKKVRYERYGGRGIGVCDEWRDSYEAFYNWAIVTGYSDDLTLDRIDFDGDYTPDNCRWVDYYTQAQNRDVGKNNKTGVIGVSYFDNKYRAYITRKGITKTLGSFDTLEEAKLARENAEEHYKKYKTIENL